jgi:hypothetical protein
MGVQELNLIAYGSRQKSSIYRKSSINIDFYMCANLHNATYRLEAQYCLP